MHLMHYFTCFIYKKVLYNIYLFYIILYIHILYNLREYTYVPHGSGIVYITIAQRMHRGRRECPGMALAVVQKVLMGSLR